MKHELEELIADAVQALFGQAVGVELTRPEERFGDYATNVALQLAKPAVVRFHISPDGHTSDRIEIPHQPFDDVFYPAVEADNAPAGQSGFIQNLAALLAQRTASGAGLEEFLDRNLGQFEPRVADEIRLLAKEVLPRG